VSAGIRGRFAKVGESHVGKIMEIVAVAGRAGKK